MKMGADLLGWTARRRPVWPPGPPARQPTVRFDPTLAACLPPWSTARALARSAKASVADRLQQRPVRSSARALRRRLGRSHSASTRWARGLPRRGGEIRSLTLLVDSISPQAWPAVKVWPSSGRVTPTTSSRESCAKSVILTRARPLLASALTQRWSSLYPVQWVSRTRSFPVFGSPLSEIRSCREVQVGTGSQRRRSPTPRRTPTGGAAVSVASVPPSRPTLIRPRAHAPWA
jgi:hypothetical protein